MTLPPTAFETALERDAVLRLLVERYGREAIAAAYSLGYFDGIVVAYRIPERERKAA